MAEANERGQKSKPRNPGSSPESQKMKQEWATKIWKIEMLARVFFFTRRKPRFTNDGNPDRVNASIAAQRRHYSDEGGPNNPVWFC